MREQNAASLPTGLSTEVQKFDALAHEFWDPRGAFHPLHALNPVRLDYIAQRCDPSQRRIADVGCGGGLLAESLARRGAQVCGIDLAPAMIEVAQLHAHQAALPIDYRVCSTEQLSHSDAGRFDAVTCMELIEHVDDPAALVQQLATLLRPGGDLFVSTINRNLRSFLMAIVGAEYLLNLIPRGTHEYARLLRPAELARLARTAGLALCDVSGIEFNPFSRTARLSDDARVNYLAHFRRDG